METTMPLKLSFSNTVSQYFYDPPYVARANLCLCKAKWHVAVVKMWLLPFLTSALDGGKLSTTRFGKFNPGGKRRLYVLKRTLGRPHRLSGL